MHAPARLVRRPSARKQRCRPDARHLAPGRADRPDAEGLRRLTPLPARTASVAFGGGGSATLRCACSPPALERRRSTDSHLAGTITWPTGSRSEEHTSELQSLMRISYAV